MAGSGYYDESGATPAEQLAKKAIAGMYGAGDPAQGSFRAQMANPNYGMGTQPVTGATTFDVAQNETRKIAANSQNRSLDIAKNISSAIPGSPYFPFRMVIPQLVSAVASPTATNSSKPSAGGVMAPKQSAADQLITEAPTNPARIPLGTGGNWQSTAASTNPNAIAPGTYVRSVGGIGDTGSADTSTSTPLPSEDLAGRNATTAQMQKLQDMIDKVSSRTTSDYKDQSYGAYKRRLNTPIDRVGVGMTPEQETAHLKQVNDEILAQGGTTGLGQRPTGGNKDWETVTKTEYGVAMKDRPYVEKLVAEIGKLGIGKEKAAADVRGHELGLEGTKVKAKEDAASRRAIQAENIRMKELQLKTMDQNTDETRQLRQEIANDKREQGKEQATQKADEAYYKRHVITDINPETNKPEPNDTLTFLRMAGSGEKVPERFKDDVAKAMAGFEDYVKSVSTLNKRTLSPDERELTWRRYFNKFRRYPKQTE